ncbi:G-protein-signaling modulator 1 [Oryzias melastigma]|uniref:G-protein-signaling modulator 1 n=1 Tax=Oryzias melastigma TaxID=30732 RepID=A0A834CHL6_ORYME|nr:G-protein-signaling modulator 1 [Oryzias melastigma]
MTERELLEPLIIVEDEDATVAVSDRDTAASPSGAEEKEKEEHSEAGAMPVKEQSLEERVTEEGRSREDEEENVNKNEDPSGDGSEGQTQKEGNLQEKQREEKGLTSSEQQPEEAEALKEAHRLTPEFPEALYELLCTLQEGRRLNDQRCSFSMEKPIGRRRCHSEPNASKPAPRVTFSSMTSLQKEEFFDLVATAQARRLNDQRAQLQRSLPAKQKSRSFRGSLRQLSLKRPTPVVAPAPAAAPKEDLYDMILTRQAQGRLEDQRSRAPGPMDDEDFFSLLLRVQGGRMDEQRTVLPLLLKT